MFNEIILVDSSDREIGRTTKYEAHYRPLLHRAFSLFIYDGENLLLQRRALARFLLTAICAAVPWVKFWAFIPALVFMVRFRATCR